MWRPGKARDPTVVRTTVRSSNAAWAPKAPRTIERISDSAHKALRFLRERATMFGCPEYLHRRTDVRQAVRLGNRALHHELSVPGQRDARADVVAEIDDLPERARQTAAGMPVDCIPGRADLHSLRPQRYGNCAAARHLLDKRTFDRRVSYGDPDRATAVGNGLQPALQAVVL